MIGVTKLLLMSVWSALIQAMISAWVGLPAVAIEQSDVETAGTEVRVLLVIVLSWKKCKNFWK